MGKKLETHTHTEQSQGHFLTSPFFYGSYGNETYKGETVHYNVPLMYFIVNLFILGYSFFAILSKLVPV